MNKEYEKNQKSQRKSFKNYRKYIKKGIILGAIAVASAFVIPFGGLMTALKGVVGESLAMNATFFTQWGLTALGGIGAIVNGIKARNARKNIDNAQDEEENIIDGMVNETDDLKRKVNQLEKTKTKTLEENEKIKVLDDKEKEIHRIENEDELDKGKQFVK